MSAFRSKILSEDSTTLQASWLPLPEPGLLIGLKDIFKDAGLAVILDAEQAAAMAEGLEGSDRYSFTSPDNVTISTIDSNRGEPFRKGMEIVISIEWDKIESVFIEEDDVPDLVQLIRSGLPT